MYQSIATMEVVVCTKERDVQWCVPRHIKRVVVYTEAYKVSSGVYQGMWCL